MRGRKPIPIDVRRRTGDYRGHAPRQAALGAGRLGSADPMPRRPSNLSAHQARAWRELVTVLRKMSILDRADAAMVEAAAIFLGRAREARDALAQPGVELLTRSARGFTTNPLLVIERESLSQFRQLAEHLGLSPMARTRLPGSSGRTMEDEINAVLGPSGRARLRDA